MLLRNSLLALVAFALAPGAAHAAKSYDSCTGYIDAVPATITTQGTWCLRKDLATGITSGNAIAVETNNVTIDCNGFKLGNLEAGDNTLANGVKSKDRLAITVRNCTVRGFRFGIAMTGTGGNHRVEGNRVEDSTIAGVWVVGDGSTIRGNTVRDIGRYAYGLGYGINATGAVDIIDNAVAGVSGTSAYGIYVANDHGGTISRNRVGGLGPAVDVIVGITEHDSTGMSLRENFVSAADGAVGLSCTDGAARAQGNTVQGFNTGISGCGDAGLNDVSP